MKHSPVQDIKRFSLVAVLFWFLVIALSCVWNLYQGRNSIREMAVNQAVNTLEKDILYRRWAARHGGVYVPVTGQTPPNPYLKDIPEREITTPSGRVLTLLNPAYMTRQVFEMGRESNQGVRGHITSLNPHRPENKPDIWEKTVLLNFEKDGTLQASIIEQMDGEPFLRYMRAFVTEQGCMKCHADQGYKNGDIRGGISVSIPMTPFFNQEKQQLKTIATGHACIFLIGLGFIQLVRQRLTVSLKREDTAKNALEDSQKQIFQQEKMASIGQMAAGVAHEINNPMGFITSNLSTLGKYVSRITEYLDAVDQAIAESVAPAQAEVAALRSRLKLDYIVKDTRQLIEESLEGATRVKNIVDDLKNLSRTDKQEMVQADLNKIIASSLNIACNEIKYIADIDLKLGDIPDVLCHPQQLSQVFINLLSNAGHAIDGHGTITIRTWSDRYFVCASVADTGKGIPEEIRSHIFEPFFTTKDVGKGTGLGLSISYDILQKHGGEIIVEGTAGQGSVFTIKLPLTGNAAGLPGEGL